MIIDHHAPTTRCKLAFLSAPLILLSAAGVAPAAVVVNDTSISVQADAANGGPFSEPSVDGDSGTTGTFAATATKTAPDSFTSSVSGGATASASLTTTVTQTPAGGLTVTTSGQFNAESNRSTIAGNPATADARALFSGLEFEVTGASVNYTLTGLISGTSSSLLFSEGGAFFADVALSDDDFNVIESFSVFGDPGDPLATASTIGSGTLAPGTYSLGFSANASTQSTSPAPTRAAASVTFDNVTLTLTEVPEPASLALLGLGAGMLLTLRRGRGARG